MFPSGSEYEHVIYIVSIHCIRVIHLFSGGIHNIVGGGGGGGGGYTDCIHSVQRGRWEEAPPSRKCITSERTRWAMVCPLGGRLAFNWHLTINCRLGYFFGQLSTRNIQFLTLRRHVTLTCLRGRASDCICTSCNALSTNC